MRMRGLTHIYTGDGKGKTTAAVGLIIRCVGNQGKVLFAQFLKDNHSSERNVLKQLPMVTVVSSEKTFGFLWELSKDELQEVKEVYNRLLQSVLAAARTGQYRMMVLDEIISAYNYSIIEKEVLIDFLITKPEELEVVMTGREPATELQEFAHYISEIKKIKHPFDQGVDARIGIEM